jgi:glycosyltransferase involved in cell wall biosynthesis
MGGITYSPDNVAELSAALSKLLKDNDIRSTIGKLGKENVLKELSLEKMSEGLSKVYNSLY